MQHQRFGADHHAYAVIDHPGYPKVVADRRGRPMLIRRAVDRRIARGMGLKPQYIATPIGPLTIWRNPHPLSALRAG